MAKMIDLTGKKFGRWTVLEKAESKRDGVYWKCRCDCGTIKSVSSRLLRKGKSKNCGCLVQEKIDPRKTELIGKKFGKLTVLSHEGKNNRGKYLWKCQCDCGNVVVVTGTLLRIGQCKSCGCTRMCDDLTGKKFGKLTVLRENGRSHKQYLWECKCECGNITNVLASCLKRGTTKSCGCLNSESMQKVNEYNRKYELKEDTRLSSLNQKTGKHNTSGYKGVSFDKKAKKWRALIGFKKKSYHLGYFDKLEDAVKARREAEKKYYKPILDKYKK